MDSIERLNKYKRSLEHDELAKNTVNKYLRDAKQFETYLEEKGKTLNKGATIDYKDYLRNKYEVSTINNKIVTLNRYLKAVGEDEATIKGIRVQAQELDNIMTQSDYERIRRQAEQKGTDRDVLMLDIMYYTGIRVSELEYITMEAVKKGYADIDNKGKVRRVPLIKRLQKDISKYAKENNIVTGAIILNRYGEPLGRVTIFKRLKWLAGQARVKKDRIYPHSLRHLFAKNWLKRNGDNILQLADILGHGSLETTRIYTKLDVNEARKTME